MKKEKSIAIFWFRRDLRLEDNHGLYEALKGNLEVLPLFIFDTHILERLPEKDDTRVTFIYDQLLKINHQLNIISSSILIKHGQPEEVWVQLLKEYDVKTIYTNHDYEPYAIERDLKIEKLALKFNCSFKSFKDHVIFEKNEILKPDNKPYTVFTPYYKKWKEKIAENNYKEFPSQNYLNNFHQSNYKLPSLKSIGFIKSKIKIPSTQLAQKNLIEYAHHRNDPSQDSTTKVGIHLRFGTISIRELVRRSIGVSEQYLIELAWREFFVQILYHFPHVVTESFKPAYDHIQWRNNEEDFEKWCKGETGYPMVDAGMRELNTTGFMHNRVRMVVASFLCKHLLIDWRWGEAYFAQKLLDYDLSANNGNWQWAAGTGCDAAPYFRIFNPTSQIERFDPQLIYCKRWLPELKEGNYIPEMVEHKFARERALKVYKEGISVFKT